MQAVLRTFIRGIASERCVNRVTLIGRVGADAQLKGTVEHPVVTFSLATNSGGNKTEWHKISVFKPGLRPVAEQYVKSGSRVMVEGKISYGHIVDAQGGAVPIASIIADDIIFLTKAKDSSLDDSMADQSLGDSLSNR